MDCDNSHGFRLEIVQTSPELVIRTAPTHAPKQDEQSAAIIISNFVWQYAEHTLPLLLHEVHVTVHCATAEDAPPLSDADMRVGRGNSSAAALSALGSDWVGNIATSATLFWIDPTGLLRQLPAVMTAMLDTPLSALRDAPSPPQILNATPPTLVMNPFSTEFVALRHRLSGVPLGAVRCSVRTSPLRVLSLLLGASLSIWAEALAHSVVFYYATGVSLGALVALAALLFILLRFGRRRGVWVPAALAGAALGAIRAVFGPLSTALGGTILPGASWWDSAAHTTGGGSAVSHIGLLLCAYIGVSVAIVWAILYLRGPLMRDEKAFTLVTWAIRFCAAALLYCGTSHPGTSAVVAAALTFPFSATLQLCVDSLASMLHAVAGVLDYIPGFGAAVDAIAYSVTKPFSSTKKQQQQRQLRGVTGGFAAADDDSISSGGSRRIDRSIRQRRPYSSGGGGSGSGTPTTNNTIYNLNADAESTGGGGDGHGSRGRIWPPPASFVSPAARPYFNLLSLPPRSGALLNNNSSSNNNNNDDDDGAAYDREYDDYDATGGGGSDYDDDGTDNNSYVIGDSNKVYNNDEQGYNGDDDDDAVLDALDHAAGFDVFYVHPHERPGSPHDSDGYTVTGSAMNAAASRHVGARYPRAVGGSEAVMSRQQQRIQGSPAGGGAQVEPRRAGVAAGHRSTGGRSRGGGRSLLEERPHVGAPSTTSRSRALLQRQSHDDEDDALSHSITAHADDHHYTRSNTAVHADDDTYTRSSGGVRLQQHNTTGVRTPRSGVRNHRTTTPSAAARTTTGTPESASATANGIWLPAHRTLRTPASKTPAAAAVAVAAAAASGGTASHGRSRRAPTPTS